MIQNAIRSAVKLLTTSYGRGKLAGNFAGGAVIRELVKTLKGGGQEKVNLTPVKNIYVDPTHGINEQGHGQVVAIVYDGDDGQSYMRIGDEWKVWNGTAWV